jgi:large subunit ribosomal protein L23
MKTDAHHIIQRPLVTEESTIQRDARGHYTFRVNPHANKRQIRDAIEQLFNVKVVAVNTMLYEGKVSGRRGRYTPGRRASWKKAIVTLHKGDTIELV